MIKIAEVTGLQDSDLSLWSGIGTFEHRPRMSALRLFSGKPNLEPTSPNDRVLTRNRSSIRLFDCELAPEAPTGADEDDDQAERQVDADDLADAVEANAGARPVLSINGTFECQPRSVE